MLMGRASALYSFALLHWRGYQAGDFQWQLRAAQALLAGENPYLAIKPANVYPLGVGYFYPLPAALLGLPLARLDPYWAGALFFGLSSGLLAYGILTNGQPRRLWVFLSAPFFVSAYVAQWSPLLLAGAFISALQGFAVCKPTLGLVSWLHAPSVKGPLLAALFGVLALLWLPTWPLWWLAMSQLEVSHHLPPALMPLGGGLLLALLACRRKHGRLLAAMVLIPQGLFFYDQLALWLLPRTWRQALFMNVTGWIAWGLWYVTTAHLPMEFHIPRAEPLVLVGLFYPALLVTLLPEIHALRGALQARRRAARG